MAESPVNNQITNAVTQTNVKTVGGESPAQAMEQVYQSEQAGTTAPEAAAATPDSAGSKSGE